MISLEGVGNNLVDFGGVWSHGNFGEARNFVKKNTEWGR